MRGGATGTFFSKSIFLSKSTFMRNFLNTFLSKVLILVLKKGLFKQKYFLSNLKVLF